MVVRDIAAASSWRDQVSTREKGYYRVLMACFGVGAAGRAQRCSCFAFRMARRVAIARAFVIEPDLLLLDEPFVSLDPAMAERSREVLLRAWRARPAAVLLVTHDLVEAVSVADRILLLSAKPMQLIADVPVPEHIRGAGTDLAEAFVRKLRQNYFKVAR